MSQYSFSFGLYNQKRKCSNRKEKKKECKKATQPSAYTKKPRKIFRESHKHGNSAKAGSRKHWGIGDEVGEMLAIDDAADISNDDAIVGDDSESDAVDDCHSEDSGRFAKTTENLNKATESLKIIEDPKGYIDPRLKVPEHYSNQWIHSCQIPTNVKNRQSQKLLNYFHNVTEITKPAFYEQAKLVDMWLTRLLKNMQNYRAISDPDIGNYLKVGSASENLKAVEPNEFDAILPIFIDPEMHGLRYNVVENVENNSVPVGFGVCYVQGDDLSKITPSLKDCISNLEGNHCLCPNEFLSLWFLPLLRRSIDGLLECVPNELATYLKRVNLGEKVGTSIPVELTFQNCQHVSEGDSIVSIDLVPALPIMQSHHPGDELQDTRFIIPTKSFSSERDFVDTYCLQTSELDLDSKVMWRISNSLLEVAYINRVSERLGATSCHLTCLKILKTIRERVCHNETYRILDMFCHSSYVLKTILLHLSCDKSIDWSYESMMDRVVDFLIFLLLAIKERYMDSFFYASHPFVLKEFFPLEVYHSYDHLIEPPRRLNIMRYPCILSEQDISDTNESSLQQNSILELFTKVRDANNSIDLRNALSESILSIIAT